jgi:hypothetical protein
VLLTFQTIERRGSKNPVTSALDAEEALPLPKIWTVAAVVVKTVKGLNKALWVKLTYSSKVASYSYCTWKTLSGKVGEFAVVLLTKLSDAYSGCSGK